MHLNIARRGLKVGQTKCDWKTWLKQQRRRLLNLTFDKINILYFFALFKWPQVWTLMRCQRRVPTFSLLGKIASTQFNVIFLRFSIQKTCFNSNRFQIDFIILHFTMTCYCHFYLFFFSSFLKSKNFNNKKGDSLFILWNGLSRNLHASKMF